MSYWWNYVLHIMNCLVYWKAAFCLSCLWQALIKMINTHAVIAWRKHLKTSLITFNSLTYTLHLITSKTYEIKSNMEHILLSSNKLNFFEIKSDMQSALLCIWWSIINLPRSPVRQLYSEKKSNLEKKENTTKNKQTNKTKQKTYKQTKNKNKTKNKTKQNKNKKYWCSSTWQCIIIWIVCL